MLNIIFGRNRAPKGYVLDTRKYFMKMKQPWWFEDSFVQDFLKNIDGSTVIMQECIRNRWGVAVAPEKISTGCKTLCCILFDELGKTFYGSAMGDNCIPYLLKIAKDYHDVNIFLEHYMILPEEVFESGLIRVNGETATEEDYDDAYVYWAENERI